MSAGHSRRIDDLLARAGLDPADGVQIVAADRLPAVAFDPSFPLLVLSGGSDRDPTLPGRHSRRGPRAVLSALYPPSHGLRRLADFLRFPEPTAQGLAHVIAAIHDASFLRVGFRFLDLRCAIRVYRPSISASTRASSAFLLSVMACPRLCASR